LIQFGQASRINPTWLTYQGNTAEPAHKSRLLWKSKSIRQSNNQSSNS